MKLSEKSGLIANEKEGGNDNCAPPVPFHSLSSLTRSSELGTVLQVFEDLWVPGSWDLGSHSYLMGPVVVPLCLDL